MNITIGIYKKSTGELIRVCSVPEDDVLHQLAAEEEFIKIEDESLIADMYSGNYKRYFVEFDVIKALPEQPSFHHTFDYSLKTWVDLRSLAELKDARWEFIKSEREAAINANLATPYGEVDSKEKDRVNITNSVMMLQTLAGLGTPGTVQFTMADNSSMELDTAKMVHIGLLLGQKIEAAHAKSRALREAIYSAETKEAVNAIFWE